ncbi:MAG: hypothetical protein AB8B80_00465 [Marinicellaceae bacterium]
MKQIQFLVCLLFSVASMSLYSADTNFSLENIQPLNNQTAYFPKLITDNSKPAEINYNLNSNEFSITKSDNNDWINIQTDQNKNYSITQSQNLTFGNELSFAWNFTNLFKINLNVFENQFQDSNYASFESYDKFFGSADKNSTIDYSSEINRSITGYKFGISSELGLGNNYKLDLNLDYGQLDGANLVGFTSEEISTTSFALGIRKSKFGASVNTDIYLEDNIDLMESSRLGFEIDWYFSDETKISLGSKQRMNNIIPESNNSLDSLTGNVQYIKFQHNL